jgi:fatty acid desaturase
MPSHPERTSMVQSQTQSAAMTARLPAAAVPAEWRKIPRWYGLFATLRLLGGFSLVVALTPWAVLSVSPWTLIPLAIVLGVLAYKLTMLEHDCSHNTLFAKSRHNWLVGHICAGILGSDFRQFTHLHWLHHQRLGTLEDPQRPDYVGLRDSAAHQIVWHLVRPLLGYNVFFKLLQYSTGRLIRSTDERPPAPAPMVRPRLLPIVTAQGTIALLITGFGQVWWLMFFYPACAATIGLFLSQTRGFAEHAAPASTESEIFIRTHLPNVADRAAFFTLNFNYHLEHHMHPSVPSCYLPKLHQILREQYHTPDTLSPGILATIRTRLAQARSCGALPQ